MVGLLQVGVREEVVIGLLVSSDAYIGRL
jgi:hypothetical protein